MGQWLSAVLPFWGSFWQSTVQPCVIHSGRSSSPINILFICEETRSCRLLRFLIQYPWTTSLPGTFQFRYFLHCYLIFSTLMLTLSWGHSSFTLSLSSDLSAILPLCYALFWHPKYRPKTLCILLHLVHHSIKSHSCLILRRSSFGRVKNPVLSKLFNSLVISFDFCAFFQHPLF